LDDLLVNAPFWKNPHFMGLFTAISSALFAIFSGQSLQVILLTLAGGYALGWLMTKRRPNG
jgi:hypothetical protein